MGDIVEFPSNGHTATGYLAGENGPGVVVIQEWWGLVDHIKDVCDRFAAEGFVALAPDLYHGATADEPDEARKQLMSLNIEQAGKDMAGAVDFVRDRSTTTGIGVTGFCMGGALALLLAALRPDAVAAVAPFYGVIGWPAPDPDWGNVAAAVQGHYAEHDDTAGPDKVAALEAKLREAGKDVEMFVYPGTHHAFFNDTRPEVYDAEAAALAWQRVTDFFRKHLV